MHALSVILKLAIDCENNTCILPVSEIAKDINKNPNTEKMPVKLTKTYPSF